MLIVRRRELAGSVAYGVVKSGAGRQAADLYFVVGAAAVDSSGKVQVGGAGSIPYLAGSGAARPPPDGHAAGGSELQIRASYDGLGANC